MISVRFEGGAELAKALNSLSTRVSRNTQREVLRDVAEPMRSRISSLAPRAPGAPDIADNIVVSNATKKDLQSQTEVGVRVGPARGFIYGYFQEFGTTRHGAQPFMRPAFDSEAPRALSEIGKRLWVELAGRGIGRSVVSDGPMSGGPGGSNL